MANRLEQPRLQTVNNSNLNRSKNMGYNTTKRDYNWSNWNEALDHVWKYERNGSFKIMHNTIASIDGANNVSITLHNTDIYKIELGPILPDNVTRIFPAQQSIITLDSGGYQTVTTKDRMNRFLPLGYRVYQKDFDWYLQTPEGTREYQDGMQIKLELA